MASAQAWWGRRQPRRRSQDNEVAVGADGCLAPSLEQQLQRPDVLVHHSHLDQEEEDESGGAAAPQGGEDASWLKHPQQQALATTACSVATDRPSPECHSTLSLASGSSLQARATASGTLPGHQAAPGPATPPGSVPLAIVGHSSAPGSAMETIWGSLLTSTVLAQSRDSDPGGGRNSGGVQLRPGGAVLASTSTLNPQSPAAALADSGRVVARMPPAAGPPQQSAGHEAGVVTAPEPLLRGPTGKPAVAASDAAGGVRRLQLRSHAASRSHAVRVDSPSAHAPAASASSTAPSLDAGAALETAAVSPAAATSQCADTDTQQSVRGKAKSISCSPSTCDDPPSDPDLAPSRAAGVSLSTSARSTAAATTATVAHVPSTSTATGTGVVASGSGNATEVVEGSSSQTLSVVSSSARGGSSLRTHLGGLAPGAHAQLHRSVTASAPLGAVGPGLSGGLSPDEQLLRFVSVTVAAADVQRPAGSVGVHSPGSSREYSHDALRKRLVAEASHSPIGRIMLYRAAATPSPAAAAAASGSVHGGPSRDRGMFPTIKEGDDGPAERASSDEFRPARCGCIVM